MKDLNTKHSSINFDFKNSKDKIEVFGHISLYRSISRTVKTTKNNPLPKTNRLSKLPTWAL